MKKSIDSNRIKIENLHTDFIWEVEQEPGCEAISLCYACGTCTAGCPVRAVSSRYNPRRIIRQVITGQRDAVIQNDFIWLCSSCYTCQERCPQGVKITDIMVGLRNIAAREGFGPPSHQKQKDLILKYGRLYEIDEFDNKKRRKVGLPAIQSDASDLIQLQKSIHGDLE